MTCIDTDLLEEALVGPPKPNLHIEIEMSLMKKVRELELEVLNLRRDLSADTSAPIRYEYKVVLINTTADIEKVNTAIQQRVDEGWELMGIPVCVKSDIYSTLWHYFRRPMRTKS